MRNAFLSLALTAGLLLPAACGRETPAPKPVTEADARAFGAAYRDAILEPNPVRAAAMFDWSVLSQRASEGTGRVMGLLFRAALKKQSAASFTTPTTRMVRGGDIRLLRVRTTRDGVLALMRLITQANGVDYQEILLERGSDDVVRGVDVLTFSNGAYLSETLRDFYLANTKTILPDLLTGKSTPLAQHINEYHEFYADLRAHQYQQAEAVFQKLPPELRKQRALMLAHVTVLQHIGGDGYLRAIDEYRAAYPNAGADLLAVNVFRLRKRYDDALRAVDRVDAAVGGDPYQDSVRAGIYLERGDLDAARTAAARAMQREPTLLLPYYQQIRLALTRHDFAGTARLLTALGEHSKEDGLAGATNVIPGDLTILPICTEFVKSPEYRAYLATSQSPQNSPVSTARPVPGQ